MAIKLPYRMLIFDIETAYLKANVWRLGEQQVRHGQLDPSADMYAIYTISYKWYGNKEVHCLVGENAVEEFDKIVRRADVVLGKNNTSFDNKYVNTQRMLKGLKPLPQWMDISDDLERQIRKYFVFPSYSLDYVSKLFGFGGKIKMEFDDWVNIANYELLQKFTSNLTYKSKKVKEETAFCKTMFKDSVKNIVYKGAKAWLKMIKYNKKDVLDTENVLKKILPYIKLKYNAAAWNETGHGCITCGSTKLVPTKMITKGKTRYQEFECLKHKGYAGKATIVYDKNRNKTFGNMG